MKKLFATAGVLALLSVPAGGFASETFKLDPSHTNITWQVSHLGFSFPNGKLAHAEGEITLNEQKPENSSVRVTIYTEKLVSGVEKLDEHMKGKEFFNTAQYKEAVFKSTGVVQKDATHATVTGELTLLGVTKPVVLEVTLNKIGEHPMNHKKTVGFSATTTIKRSEFGMGYGIPNVSDEVKLTIETEASEEKK